MQPPQIGRKKEEVQQPSFTGGGFDRDSKPGFLPRINSIQRGSNAQSPTYSLSSSPTSPAFLSVLPDQPATISEEERPASRQQNGGAFGGFGLNQSESGNQPQTRVTPMGGAVVQEASAAGDDDVLTIGAEDSLNFN